MTRSDCVPGPASKGICTVLCLGLFSGCSTLELPEYDPTTNETPSVSVAREGIHVTLQPLANPQDVERYFGDDLLNLGILPVFVSVENRSPSSSFVLAPGDFSLANAATGVVEAMKDDRDRVGSPGAGTAVTTLGAVSLLFVPIAAFVLLPIGAKIGSNATVVRHTFLVREWQPTTISPGEATSGFLYLQESSREAATVRIRALRLPGSEPVVLGVPLPGDRP